MRKTDNPIQLLVAGYDSIQWAKNLLILMQAEQQAYLTWAHFPDNERYFEKYARLRDQVDLYPPAPEEYDYTGETT